MPILLPYQSELVQRRNRFEINVKSRQVGFSFAYGFKKTFRGILEDRDQMIVSASLRQSRTVMGYVEKFIESFLKLPQCKGLKLITDNVYEKRFNNRKAIMCLPASPATIRSLAGDVLFDEFSLYKKDREIYEAMTPSITRGYDLEICGTPLGQNNLFYEIYSKEDKYKKYKRFSINIYQAIKQGLKVDVEDIRASLDEESFAQEYLCEFVDSQTTFFPYELLRRCIDDYDDNIKGAASIGVDIGRTNDLTCIVETREEKGIFYHIKRDTMKKAEFDDQEFVIKQRYKESGAVAGMVDKGAVGYQLAEKLERDLPGMVGVFTNQQSFFAPAVTYCKRLMEQGKFKITEDRNLINAFHKIQKVVTVNNTVSFVIKRDKDGHGDEAVAAILSLYANHHSVVPRARRI